MAKKIKINYIIVAISIWVMLIFMFGEYRISEAKLRNDMTQWLKIDGHSITVQEEFTYDNLFFIVINSKVKDKSIDYLVCYRKNRFIPLYKRVQFDWKLNKEQKNYHIYNDEVFELVHIEYDILSKSIHVEKTSQVFDLIKIIVFYFVIILFVQQVCNRKKNH